MKKQRPSTTSYFIPYTKAQKAAVKKLESEGWQLVSLPESIFEGACLVEDPQGRSHYVTPDGEVR